MRKKGKEKEKDQKKKEKKKEEKKEEEEMVSREKDWRGIKIRKQKSMRN